MPAVHRREDDHGGEAGHEGEQQHAVRRDLSALNGKSRTLGEETGLCALQEHGARDRLLTLSPSRLCLALLLFMALATALAGAASRWVHGEAARRDAQAAIAFVDQRLDAVADELAHLSADLAIREPWLAASDCPPTLIAALARASLDSVRSEERRVGKECIPPCRSRWSPYH